MRRLVGALGAIAVLIVACTDLGGLNAGADVPDGSAASDTGVVEPGGDASAPGDADAPIEAGVDGGADSGCDGPCPRIIFVTSATYAGDLGGLQGADAKCAASASARFGGKTFLAWLSTGGVGAASRFTDVARPFVRVDGTRVAADRAQITSGTLQAPVSQNESGLAVPPLAEVWTGTDGSGQAAPATCASWSKSDIAEMGAYGVATASSVIWTYSAEASCSSSRHLYCVEN